MAILKVKEWDEERLIYFWSDAPEDCFEIRGEWWIAIREILEREFGELNHDVLEKEIMNIFVNLGKQMQSEMEKKEKWVQQIYA